MMKRLRVLLVLLCLMLVDSYKAQTIRPLNTVFEQVQSGDYLKDLNDDLFKFTGEWKASLPDKKVTLVITKELHQPYEVEGPNFFMDCLLIRYKVTDLNGTVLQETLTKDFSANDNLKIMSVRYKASENLASLIANPNACQVGMGIVYLKWLSQNSLQWEYQPMTAHISDDYCWSHQEKLKVHLPADEKVIFTRQ